MKNMLMLGVIAVATSFANAADVIPGVIFGSGNANGNFTVNTGSGIELGLRAKKRYNLSGVSDGVNNWDGVDTYTFDPDNGNPPANRAMWNFEFSINADVEGTTGNKLNDFTYELALFKVNADGTVAADAFIFDPINAAYADHSIGNNMTTDSTDMVAGDPASYATLIDTNNVAQNSWNYGFFNGSGTGILEGIDPAAIGTYIIRLTAYSGGIEVVSTDINVTIVPLPTAALAGLGMLGAFAGVRTIRRR